MTGIATITMRKYMVLRTFDLSLGSAGNTEFGPWTGISVALTRLPPAVNASLSQLDEPVGLGYGRKAYPWGPTGWTLTNDTEVVNNTAIPFTAATGFWGTMTGWALIAYAHVIAVGTLNTPLKVSAGTAPVVPVGAISFGIF